MTNFQGSLALTRLLLFYAFSFGAVNLGIARTEIRNVTDSAHVGADTLVKGSLAEARNNWDKLRRITAQAVEDLNGPGGGDTELTLFFPGGTFYFQADYATDTGKSDGNSTVSETADILIQGSGNAAGFRKDRRLILEGRITGEYAPGNDTRDFQTILCFLASPLLVVGDEPDRLSNPLKQHPKLHNIFVERADFPVTIRRLHLSRDRPSATQGVLWKMQQNKQRNPDRKRATVWLKIDEGFASPIEMSLRDDRATLPSKNEEFDPAEAALCVFRRDGSRADAPEVSPISGKVQCHIPEPPQKTDYKDSQGGWLPDAEARYQSELAAYQENPTGIRYDDVDPDGVPGSGDEFRAYGFELKQLRAALPEGWVSMEDTLDEAGKPISGTGDVENATVLAFKRKSAIGGSTIRIEATDDSVVEDVRITMFAGNPIRSTHDTDNLRVSRVRIERPDRSGPGAPLPYQWPDRLKTMLFSGVSGGIQLVVGADGPLVEDCRLVACADDGIGIFDKGRRKQWINAKKHPADSDAVSPNLATLLAERPAGTLISNCTVQDNMGDGIILVNCGIEGSPERSVCEGNLMLRCGQRGIWIVGYSTDWDIRDNVFRQLRSAPAIAAGLANATCSAVIQDNRFEEASRNNPVLLVTGGNITFSGNWLVGISEEEYARRQIRGAPATVNPLVLVGSVDPTVAAVSGAPNWITHGTHVGETPRDSFAVYDDNAPGEEMTLKSTNVHVQWDSKPQGNVR